MDISVTTSTIGWIFIHESYVFLGNHKNCRDEKFSFDRHTDRREQTFYDADISIIYYFYFSQRFVSVVIIFIVVILLYLKWNVKAIKSLNLWHTNDVLLQLNKINKSTKFKLNTTNLNISVFYFYLFYNFIVFHSWKEQNLMSKRQKCW